MISKKILIEEFQYIRSNFFPKWDKNNQWRIDFWKNYPSIPREYANSAGANQAEKLILFSGKFLSVGIPFLRATIIHEICHAVCQKPTKGFKWPEEWHWKDPLWRKRMIKAIQQAERLKQSLLKWFLKSDLELQRIGDYSWKSPKIFLQIEQRKKWKEQD